MFGIEAIAVEIPFDYVDEKDLEIVDKCEGKYTKGLLLNRIAVPSKDETACSLAEKVLVKLMKYHSIRPEEIGRLEVATESMTDRSKSIKSYLMKHFQGVNKAVEGIDVYHACYSATSAFFSALEWMNGPWWNGKKAIVIASDIAINDYSYKFINGCGAVALLLGPNGKIKALEGHRYTSCSNEFDFYKPIKLEYPVLDSELSIYSYFTKLNECLDQLELETKGTPSFLSDCARWIFHGSCPGLCKKASVEVSHKANVKEEAYEKRTQTSTEWLSEAGCMYSATLFVNLACLLSKEGNKLATNKSKILLYSYGSGAMATIFILEVLQDITPYIYGPWDTKVSKTKLNINDWIELFYSKYKLKVL
jgi:hydroxymethylglutaryl-CoA synthase